MGHPNPNKGKQSARCKRDHDDWVIDGSGERRCKTCRDLNRHKMKVELGKGPEDQTFTYTELMKARGYVA